MVIAYDYALSKQFASFLYFEFGLKCGISINFFIIYRWRNSTVFETLYFSPNQKI